MSEVILLMVFIAILLMWVVKLVYIQTKLLEEILKSLPKATGEITVSKNVLIYEKDN